MSALANRMKGIAPSAQVTSLLSGSFSVPSRGRKTVVGLAAQLKPSSGNITTYGGQVYNGIPYVLITNPSNSQPQVYKISTALSSITWAKNIAISGGLNSQTNCLEIDSSGNPSVFTTGGVVSLSAGDGSRRGGSSSGLTWYSANDHTHGATADVIYTSGWGINGTGDTYVQKVNVTGGTITWGMLYQSSIAPNFDQGFGVVETLDSSWLYIGSRVQGNSPNYNNFHVMKVNSGNGNPTWQYMYHDTSDTSWQPYVLQTDASSNVYVGTDKQTIVKLDSSGNISWQKSFGSGARIHDMYYDTSNTYIYAINENGAVYVLDSSGNTIFTRSFTCSAGTLQGKSIKTYSSDMYITLSISNRVFVVKLPKDGTGVDGIAEFSDGTTLAYSQTSISSSNATLTRYSGVMSTSGYTTGGSTSPTITDATTLSSISGSGI